MFSEFQVAKYEVTLEAGEKGLNLPLYKGSTLRGGFGSAFIHHGIKPEGDFQEEIKRAEQVKTVFQDTRWVDWERYSSRQDTRMKLGGVVGKVTYQGELAELWPLLIIGQWTHVGKAVTFGMGKYRVKEV
ncbi:MAG: hypothetical protein PWP31_51 [Clostridia bacterium]|nr:hypothetical protein [Clostridia bacterium]